MKYLASLQMKRGPISNDMIFSIKLGDFNFTTVLNPDEFIEFIVNGSELVLAGNMPTKLISLDELEIKGDYIAIGPDALNMRPLIKEEE